MPSLSIVSATILVLLAIFAGYLYIVGIPPELKRDLERKALRTMGENKASYLMKNQIENLPEGPAGDVPGVKDLKKGLGGLGGGALRNPLGEEVGERGDEAARPVTGR